MLMYNKKLLQAQDKGESTTMFGLVIGTNCLTAFLVTPFIGKNVSFYLLAICI